MITEFKLFEAKGIYKINLRDLIVDEFNELNLPYDNHSRKPGTDHYRISREERLTKLLVGKYISFYYDIRILNNHGHDLDEAEKNELISGECEVLTFKEEESLNNIPVRNVLTVQIKHVDEDNEIFSYYLDWTKPITINNIKKTTARFDL